MFNITYYPDFQTIRTILRELNFILTLDDTHNNVFSEIPNEVFKNNTNL